MGIHAPATHYRKKTRLGTYIIIFHFHDWGGDYIDDDVKIGL